MRKKIILLFFILNNVFLFSCGGCKKKHLRNSRTITIGLSQEPDSLFMPFKEMMASEEVVRAGNYTLTIFDEKWRLIPWAAKEIPTLENGLLELFREGGVEKMRTTWHIKDDFFWPDGKPLTADDFVFTQKVVSDPKQEVVDRTVIEKIEKMESRGKDKKTLIVTWNERYAYYHNYRQHEAVPKHLVEPLYDQEPEKLKKAKFGQAPALAGSFTIKEWIPGSHIVAERNPSIKGMFVPNMDEIIWRLIPQTNTLEANLVSGTIDAISPTGLTIDQAMQIEKRHKDKFDFYYTDGLQWEHVDFNLDNEILADKKVRMALAYGADRKGIAKSLFEDRQPVAHGTEPPKSPYFNQNIKHYHYSPELAKKLLDEAGWLLPPEKEIREKNGKPLSLVIMTTSGSRVREQIEQFLQSQWRQIGVQINIRNQPAKVFFGETMRHRKYDGMAMYAWLKDPLVLSDTLWRCDYIPSEQNNYLGQNYPGWCNKQADKIVKMASKTLDEESRIKIGQDFEVLFAEELPALPLFFRMEVSITRKKLKNWKPTGMLQPVSWNAYEWKLDF